MITKIEMFPRIETPAEGVTLQWIYDRAKAHLLKQNARSVDGNPENISATCMYRSADGKYACAAGCFIADGQYASEIESSPSHGVEITSRIEASIGRLPEKGRALIRKLQEMHDELLPGSWPHRLPEIARLYELHP